MCPASKLLDVLFVPELSAPWQPSRWTGSPGPSRACDAGTWPRKASGSSVRYSQEPSPAQLDFPVQPARSFLFLPSSSGKNVTANQTPDSEGVPVGAFLVEAPGALPALAGQQCGVRLETGPWLPLLPHCSFPPRPHSLCLSSSLSSPLHQTPPTTCHFTWSRWRITAL